MKTLCIATLVTTMAVAVPAIAQTQAAPTTPGATPVVGTKSKGDSAGNTGTTSTGSGKTTGSAAASGSVGGDNGAISSGSTSVSGSGTEPAKASLSGSGNSVKSVPNNGLSVRQSDNRMESANATKPTAVPGSTNGVSPASK